MDGIETLRVGRCRVGRVLYSNYNAMRPRRGEVIDGCAWSAYGAYYSRCTSTRTGWITDQQHQTNNIAASRQILPVVILIRTKAVEMLLDL